MNRRSLMIVPLLFAVAACSKAAPENATQTLDVSETPAAERAGDAATSAPPGIDASVAPGVAFDFSYAFALPETAIATVQESHAALCGRLGALHCRVTGLSFQKARDGEIDASMQFLLDPAMALSFTKDATALVEKAEGKLATSSVKGENAGKAIVAGDKSADAIKAELAKIDAQLRIPGLSKSARGELVARSGALRTELRELTTKREALVESLATTPVAFDYEVAAPGFGFQTPFAQGIAASTTSFGAMLSFMALLLGTVGPWALLGGAIWWGVRRLRAKPVAAE